VQKPSLERVASGRSATAKRPRGAHLDGHYELLVEHPFDSTIKRMSVAYKFFPSEGSSEKEHVVLLMKGAVVSLIPFVY
jgi:Na+-exporting ATPase